MRRQGAILVAAVVLVAGAGAIWWFGQGTETPTVGATAPAVQTTTSTTDAPVGEATSTLPAEEGPGELVSYSFTADSFAEFVIEEELRGQPTTVVARSAIVLGEALLDPDGPSSLQVGTILVNARDFTTDSSNRNRAIRGPILDSDAFEFIEFVPDDTADLPDAPATSVAFSVSGNLVIKGVASPVTFDVVAEVAEDGSVSGTAEATVDRTRWGLNIPSAPGVANVSETVLLRLEFVAVPSA